MREIIRGLLINNSQLTDLIPADRWLSSGSVDEDSVPARMFVVIRFGLTEIGLGNVKRGSCTFWVHDDPGSYTRIDDVLAGIAGTLDGVQHVSDGNGNELMEMKWEANSGDLFDTGYRTITRTATYNFVGTGA